MSDTKKLLEIRKAMKKKRPSFMRKDIYKKSRLGSSWRKPRGLDNKQRLCKRGPAKKISNGYRAPGEIRGLHNSGLIPIVVSNIFQLNALTKEHGVIISGKVGDRKRSLIIAETKKKGLEVLNFDADKRAEQIATELKQRKESQKKKLDEQKEKEKEKKKGIDEKVKKEEQKEPKKEEEAQLSDEEKKKLEKEEKDKLLTKRE
jgi:large subunit ribosomal protein L32e